VKIGEIEEGSTRGIHEERGSRMKRKLAQALQKLEEKGKKEEYMVPNSHIPRGR
jgi:hypothetical protein